MNGSKLVKFLGDFLCGSRVEPGAHTVMCMAIGTSIGSAMATHANTQENWVQDGQKRKINTTILGSTDALRGS